MGRNKILLLLVIIIGFLCRAYLVVSLPLWHDEAYSIWASQSTLSRIISGSTDPVHPPGYYLLLHFWGFASDHLYWFRLTSLIGFLTNCCLLIKLGKKVKRDYFSLILVFTYSLSGYFVIFDWQVRMYSLILTVILLDLLILDTCLANKIELPIKNIIFFTLINIFGLYLDYAYFWYFIPLIIFVLASNVIRKKRINLYLIASLISSWLIFILIHPSLMDSYRRGLDGITWMQPYLNPGFFIPYFLGSPGSVFFTVLLIILFFLGLNIFFRLKQMPNFMVIILFTSIFSLISTLIYSFLATPVFHVRSLQIVGMAVVIVISLSVYNFGGLKQTLLVLTLYTIVVANYILFLRAIYYQPGKYLISFFPWKQLAGSLDTNQISSIRYKETKQLPTPLLLWGLKYTLDGKESYPVRKIPFGKIESAGQDEDCAIFNTNLLELYRCRRAGR